jgi:hypothetical protein
MTKKRKRQTHQAIYKLRGCLAGEESSLFESFQEERRREREREERKAKRFDRRAT